MSQLVNTFKAKCHLTTSNRLRIIVLSSILAALVSAQILLEVFLYH